MRTTDAKTQIIEAVIKAVAMACHDDPHFVFHRNGEITMEAPNHRYFMGSTDEILLAGLIEAAGFAVVSFYATGHSYAVRFRERTTADEGVAFIGSTVKLANHKVATVTQRKGDDIVVDLGNGHYEWTSRFAVTVIDIDGKPGQDGKLYDPIIGFFDTPDETKPLGAATSPAESLVLEPDFDIEIEPGVQVMINSDGFDPFVVYTVTELVYSEGHTDGPADMARLRDDHSDTNIYTLYYIDRMIPLKATPAPAGKIEEPAERVQCYLCGAYRDPVADYTNGHQHCDQCAKDLARPTDWSIGPGDLVKVVRIGGFTNRSIYRVVRLVSINGETPAVAADLVDINDESYKHIALRHDLIRYAAAPSWKDHKITIHHGRDTVNMAGWIADWLNQREQPTELLALPALTLAERINEIHSVADAHEQGDTCEHCIVARDLLQKYNSLMGYLVTAMYTELGLAHEFFTTDELIAEAVMTASAFIDVLCEWPAVVRAEIEDATHQRPDVSPQAIIMVTYNPQTKAVETVKPSDEVTVGRMVPLFWSDRLNNYVTMPNASADSVYYKWVEACKVAEIDARVHRIIANPSNLTGRLMWSSEPVRFDLARWEWVYKYGRPVSMHLRIEWITPLK